MIQKLYKDVFHYFITNMFIIYIIKYFYCLSFFYITFYYYVFYFAYATII